MAVSEYKWQDADQKQIQHCWKWCQNTLNLRDWDATFDWGNRKPRELRGKAEAGVYVYPMHDKALFWIPLERLKKNDSNPYDAMLHEALHVLTLRAGFTDDHSEIISCRLSPILYEQYCMKNGIGLAELREI
jgi:hypothetical protein